MKPAMLDSVWHLRGSVPLKGDSIDADVLDSVANYLSKQQKGVIEREPNYIVFDGPFWRNPFGPNWFAMVIYERGKFWIEQDLNGRSLNYDLRSLHFMAICLFAAFILFVFGLAGDGLEGGFKFGVGTFAWLYGANTMLSLVRVPYAIRKAASSA